MRLSIPVGNDEKHIIEFRWGQFFGTVKFTVDGTVVYRGRPVAFDEVRQIASPSLYLFRTYVSKDTPNRLIRSWEMEVGKAEKHKIRVDKVRPSIFAGLRPSLFRVFIDDQLVNERVGF